MAWTDSIRNRILSFRASSRRKKLIILAFFLGVANVLGILFFLSLGRILDADIVKKFISEQIYTYTDLRIRYNSIETRVFPLPGFVLREVELRSDEEIVGSLGELRLRWNVSSLLEGNFELESAFLENLVLRIHRDSEGRIPIMDKIDGEKIEEDSEEFRKEQQENPMSPDELLGLLPVRITGRNIQIHYLDESLKREDSWLIEKIEINQDFMSRKVDMELASTLNESDLHMEANFFLTENSWDLKPLRYRVKIDLSKIQLGKYSDFLAVFYLADFQEALFHIGIESEKTTDENISVSLNRLSLENLKSSRGNSFPAINFEGNAGYNWVEDTLFVKDFRYKMEGRSSVSLNIGNAKPKKNTGDKNSQEDNKTIATQALPKPSVPENWVGSLESSQFHLGSTLAAVDIFSKIQWKRFPISMDSKSQGSRIAKTKENPMQKEKPKSLSGNQRSMNPYVSVDLDLKKLNLEGYRLDSVRGRVLLRGKKVLFQNMNLGLYRGRVILNGQYDTATKGNNLTSNILVRGLDTKLLLQDVTKDQVITGRMDSDAYLSARIGSGNIMDSLYLKNQFTISRGELLGYANFIKPVAQVGKWINFGSEKEGKSTEFHLIQGNFILRNRLISLKSFDMKGVGIDAKGSGTYSLRGDQVNMKFTASLSGNAGKVIKIPIIYKGVLGKNVAYLDPIWLASVYAGSIFLAGPAGAIVGGMTGSLASDTVEKTTETIKDGFESTKDFFFGGDEKK